MPTEPGVVAGGVAADHAPVDAAHPGLPDAPEPVDDEVVGDVAPAVGVLVERLDPPQHAGTSRGGVVVRRSPCGGSQVVRPGVARPGAAVAVAVGPGTAPHSAARSRIDRLARGGRGGYGRRGGAGARSRSPARAARRRSRPGSTCTSTRSVPPTHTGVTEPPAARSPSAPGVGGLGGRRRARAPSPSRCRRRCGSCSSISPSGSPAQVKPDHVGAGRGTCHPGALARRRRCGRRRPRSGSRCTGVTPASVPAGVGAGGASGASAPTARATVMPPSATVFHARPGAVCVRATKRSSLRACADPRRRPRRDRGYRSAAGSAQECQARRSHPEGRHATVRSARASPARTGRRRPGWRRR